MPKHKEATEEKFRAPITLKHLSGNASSENDPGEDTSNEAGRLKSGF